MKIKSKKEFLFRQFFRLIPHRGIRVVNENWDILIVLDACRYDFFKKINTIKGRLEKRISLGSSTPEWIKKNFDRDFRDIVYVSANPFVSKFMLKKMLGKNPFFYLDEVWNYGWNEQHKTVLPETVTKAISKIKNLFPNKRIIGHYMQPHHPFIHSKSSSREITAAEILRARIVEERKMHKAPMHMFYYAEKGLIDVKELWAAYTENLKLVIEEVKKLLKELRGKQVVITADHGNCFGEYGFYGHPQGIYIKPLVEVPWLRVTYEY